MRRQAIRDSLEHLRSMMSQVSVNDPSPAWIAERAHIRVEMARTDLTTEQAHFGPKAASNDAVSRLK